MSPPVDHVPSDPELPARTTVVIVGGGIIGVCTAFFLARDGIPVVLCEKGEIAAEQSSRNWGWCRKMGRDPTGDAPGDRGPATVERHEQSDRGRERISPLRHRLFVPHRKRPRETRRPGWSRSGARIRSTAGCSPATKSPSSPPVSPATGLAHCQLPAMGGPNRRTRHRRSRRRRGVTARSC